MNDFRYTSIHTWVTITYIVSSHLQITKYKINIYDVKDCITDTVSAAYGRSYSGTQFEIVTAQLNLNSSWELTEKWLKLKQ